MTTVTLCLPITLPRSDTFYSAGVGSTFLGYPIRLLEQDPYRYIEILGVEEQDAERVASLANVAMSWAAVRVGIGLLPTMEPLQRATGLVFRGEHPTALPSGLQATPARVSMSQRTEHAVGPLFISMKEIETHPGISAAVIGSAKLAFELYASSFYEVSANSRFITLTTAMEILAAGGRRRRGPISATIQQYNIDVATRLSKPNPAQYATKAGDLYKKRNGLVHRGMSVTSRDVSDLRELLQVCLMSEAGYP